MTAPEPQLYQLVVFGPASRTISQELPDPVAWAVVELITGDLLENPYRLGHELRNELTGDFERPAGRLPGAVPR